MNREAARRMSEDFRSRATTRRRGNSFEDFTPGRLFRHHWGRSITEGDNALFSTLTLSFNPLYFNAEYARAHGHPGAVVNPMLVWTTVFGLSVEDLSEGGGLFLGAEDVVFHRPVYPGDTLTAESTVVGRRDSASDPTVGIVTWHTRGFNQKQELVIDYQRTNRVRKRGG